MVCRPPRVGSLEPPTPTHGLPDLQGRIRDAQHGASCFAGAAQSSVSWDPAKEITGLSFSETPGLWAGSANPTKDNRPLINSPNLMAAPTPASPPALMSLIDWT